MHVTLITGASGGIGEAFARRFAKSKHNLFLVARSQDKLDQLSRVLSNEFNVHVHYLAVDLTQPDAALQIWARTEELKLEVNFLINNAGIGTAGDFSSIDIADELTVIQLNDASLVSMTHRFLPAMRKRNKGTIINVASMAAFQPCPFMAVYGASKAFVKSFTEAIAEENKPFNIRTLLLCPGATETNFFTAAKMDTADKEAILGKAAIETPEMVVETAMNALKTDQVVAVSGFGNQLVARLSNFMPNGLITKIMAKNARPHYQL